MEKRDRAGADPGPLERTTVLLAAPPRFHARGNLFYVDVGLRGVPPFACSPATMLGAVKRANAAIADWQSRQGKAEPACLCCKKKRKRKH